MKFIYPNRSFTTFFKNSTFFLLLVVFLSLSKNAAAQVCGVNAGLNTTICSNTALSLNGNRSGTFTVNPTWSLVSGPTTPFIVSPSANISAVTGTVAGTYVFKFSGVCSDAIAATQTVTWVLNGVTQAAAGPNQQHCPGTYTLAANAAGTGETGTWTAPSNPGGVVITSANSPTSTITLPTASGGTSLLVWTILNSTTGCSTKDTVLITNYGGVVPVDAGANQTLGNCFANSTTASLSATFGGTGFAGQQGVWTVVSGPNYPTFSSTTSNNPSLSNLITGTYKFLWTVSGPCGAGSDSVKITVPVQSVDGVPTTSNAGTSVTTCNTQTVFNLSANVPGNIHEIGTWTASGPTVPVIVSPNSPTTSVSNLTGTGTWTFTWFINNTTTGCSSTSNVSITKQLNGTPLTLNAGVDQTLSCNTTTASIPFTATGATGFTTAVRFISGPIALAPASFTNASSPYSWTGLTTAGQYVLEIRNLGPQGTNCTSGSLTDQVAITVNRSIPGANAGTDQFVPCNANSMTMAGNVLTGANPGVIGTWTQIAGPATLTITNPNNPNTTVTSISPINSGPYTFRWTVTGGTNCAVNFDDMIVFVASLTPSAPSAGPDATVCSNGNYVTAGNATAQGETALWTVSPAGPVIACNTCPVTTVTGFAANTVYKFAYKHLNVCATLTDTVVITSNSTSSAPKANAGTDQCKAAGTTTATMAANAATPGTGNWSLISGPNTPSITTASSPTTTITGMINGTYLYAWTISQPPCGAPTIDTVKITISGTATTSNAGATQNICGNTATLAANTITTGIGTWSQLSGPFLVNITNPNSPTSTVTGITTTGQYTFNWTVTNGACTGSTSTVAINVSSAVSTAAAGPDQTLCTSSGTLAANAPTVGTGAWSLVSGPSSPTFSNITSPTSGISGLVAGTYTFRWNISGGNCPPSTDDVLINVSIPANNISSEKWYGRQYSNVKKILPAAYFERYKESDRTICDKFFTI